MKWVKTIITIILLVLVCVAIYYGGLLGPIMTSGETYEKNGVTFIYPEGWSEANSVSEGSIAAVVNPKDANTSVVIQQVPSELGNDLQQAYNTNNQGLTQYGNYIRIQEASSTLNNRSVLIHRYIINEPDGKLYVVLFSTPVESYESQRSNYDKIVHSFKLIKDNENKNGFSLNL